MYNKSTYYIKDVVYHLPKITRTSMNINSREINVRQNRSGNQEIYLAWFKFFNIRDGTI